MRPLHPLQLPHERTAQRIRRSLLPRLMLAIPLPSP